MNLRYQTVFLLALATGLIFTRLSIVSLLIFVLVLVRVQPVVQRTKLQGFIWAYALTSIIIAIIYMLAWMIGLKVSPTSLLCILAALCWLIIGFGIKTKKSVPFRGSNLATIGVAFLVAIFVSLPLLRNFSAATVLRYSAHTGDDINHLAVIEADRKVSSYLYTNGPAKYENIIQPIFSNYPQGWHINGAFTESLIIKLVGSDSAITRLSSYLIYKTIWLFICVYFICDLLCTVISLMKTRIDKYALVLTAAAGLILSLGLLVPLFGYGFQSFIAETALLCAAVTVTLEYVKTKSYYNKNLYLITLGLLAVGTTYTWIISGLTVLGLIAILLIKDSLADHNYLAKWPWWLWLAMLACCGLTLTQIYIMLLFSSSSGNNFITSTGLAPPISVIGVTILLILTLFSLNTYTKKYRSWLLPIVAVVAAEFLLGSFYQQIKFGDQRYYVIKLAYSTGIILLAFLLPVIIVRLRSMRQTGIGLILFFLILLLLPVTLGLNLRKSAYPLKDSAPIKVGTANYVLSLSGNRQNSIIKTENSEESFLSTKLLSSVWASNNPARQKLLNQMNSQITP